MCETAIATNFRGMKGKMCTWYVTPCDCDFGAHSTLPRVCLTDPIEPRKLAIEVTQVMRAMPELQRKTAEEAAAEILSVLYPCDD